MRTAITFRALSCRKTGETKRYSFASIAAFAFAVHSTRPQIAPARTKTSLIQPAAGASLPFSRERIVWWS